MSATSQHDLDLLSPLRAESSPVPRAALQSYVGARSAARIPAARWVYGVATSLALGAAVFVTWFFYSSPQSAPAPVEAGSSGIVRHTARSFASAFEQMSRLVSPATQSFTSRSDRSPVSLAPIAKHDANPSYITPPNVAAALPTTVNVSSEHAAPTTIVPEAPISEASEQTTTPVTQNHVGEPSYHDPHTLANEGRVRVSAALQSGILMGSLNTLAGGAALTVSHDWQAATVRYTSTFGTRSTDLIRSRPFEQNTQDVEEYAIMFGGVLRQGDFWASLEAGPNVIHATFIRKNENVATGQWQDTSDMIGGSWGASAQATFGYQVSNYAGLSLTGFVSNHSITYGGVLVSLVAGPF